MSKFQFPNNPGVDRSNPFEGDDGANPFGDDDPKPDGELTTPDANPYAAENQDDVQPYKPEGYENFLPHRGERVFGLGLSSCCVQGAALVITVLAVLLGGFVQAFLYSLPAPLFGLALSIPAWILGHGDAAAIAAGAMDEEGRRRTIFGLWCGVIGTIVGGLHLGTLIATLIYHQNY